MLLFLNIKLKNYNFPNLDAINSVLKKKSCNSNLKIEQTFDKNIKFLKLKTFKNM